MVDYEEMSMLAAYGGFPQRYPHWRFGAQFDELMKGYSYGLQKIYEMVINTDPCYAYLLTANEMTDQKLVIAHVYGHCDFSRIMLGSPKPIGGCSIRWRTMQRA